MSIARFSAEFGALNWWWVRDIVRRMQFDGHDIEWWEGSGWLSREFAFKGSPEAIRILRSRLQAKAAEFECQAEEGRR